MLGLPTLQPKKSQVGKFTRLDFLIYSGSDLPTLQPKKSKVGKFTRLDFLIYSGRRSQQHWSDRVHLNFVLMTISLHPKP